MSSLTCPYSRRCGGCQLLAMSYEEELAHKQELARRHLSRFGKLLPILGAANPCYYRNKVEAAFGLDRSRKVIAGTYEPRSHRIVDINSCLNEDKNATAIIVTIKKLLPSFRLAPYDEDARTGFLRHVLVRRGIHTGEVIGVEQNPAAVRDAIRNAKENGVENIRFVAADATEWMQAAAAEKLSIDILLMDPPRSGSTPEFLSAAVKMAPRRIVYISCCPETQARDLALLQKGGYRVTLLQPVDMFPHTEHIENIAVLERRSTR